MLRTTIKISVRPNHSLHSADQSIKVHARPVDPTKFIIVDLLYFYYFLYFCYLLCTLYFLYFL